jgi:hypothetical protein
MVNRLDEARGQLAVAQRDFKLRSTEPLRDVCRFDQETQWALGI